VQHFQTDQIHTFSDRRSQTVKGRQKSIRIYELLSIETELLDHDRLLVQQFEKGLAFYRQQRWEDGISCFTKCLEIRPDDHASDLFIKRCRHFQKEPPDAQWSGTFEMHRK
jgi:adenylate cyclase